MSKITILIALLLLVGAGCNEGQITTWVGTAQRTDLNARAGYLDAKGTTEVGIELEYERSSEIEWGPRPDRIGPYVIFWLTQDVTITDTPEPSPFQELLESLHARPYAGGNLLGIPKNGLRDIQPNFRVGTFFTIDPDTDFGLYTEYVDGDNIVPGMRIGGMGRF